MTVRVARCAACGAETAGATCEERFERLLELDHSRREPWGPLHGVAVACFFLQHPGHPLAPRGDDGPGRALLETFLAGSREALRALTEGARRRNSHRNRKRNRNRDARPGGLRDPGDPGYPGGLAAPSAPPGPERPAPTTFGVTIAEVSVDGGFPAAGHEERVRAWAAATLAALAGDDARRPPGQE